MKVSKRKLWLILITLLLIGCKRAQLPDSVANDADQQHDASKEALAKSLISNEPDSSINLVKTEKIEITLHDENLENIKYPSIEQLKQKFQNISLHDTSKLYAPKPLIVKNPVTNSYIWPYQSFEVLFDNDMFNNTDRYYTNGVRLTFNSPALAFWRINSIFPFLSKQSIEYNSISLQHEMFTPYTTKKLPTLVNDRPYASALFITFTRRTDNPDRGISLKSSLDIGVTGEIALGSLLQKGVHASVSSNDLPIGWETQIPNDILLNYSLQLQNKIASAGIFDAAYTGSASLGSRLTALNSGIIFCFDSKKSAKKLEVSDDSDFRKPGVHSSSSDKPNKYITNGSGITYSAAATLTANLVGYNSTLNGGLFNRGHAFIIKQNEMERLTFLGSLSFTIRYRQVSLSLSQFFLTPEFKSGKSHFWGQIGIKIGY
jgi:hypothetical protein